MKASEFIGREVLDADAKWVGKVSNFEVDMARGIIGDIYVKAGPTKGYIFGLGKINIVGERIILAVKEDELVRW
jgi:sporulation protein YlmC with PRC-barrel domain